MLINDYLIENNRVVFIQVWHKNCIMFFVYK